MEQNNNKKALKSGIWYLVGNIVTKGMVFITTPIFTRIMEKEAIGDFSNFTSWIVILIVVCSADLYSSIAVARFDYKEELDNYIASILILGTCITVAWSIVFFLLRKQVISILGFTSREALLALAYCVTLPATQMFQAKARIEYKYKSVILLSVVSSLVPTVTALVCVNVFSDKLCGRELGFYIPLIGINVVIYLLLLSRSNKISRKYWNYALMISLPLVVHMLSGVVLSSSDRVMIKKMCGSVDMALYSIAYTSAMLVSVLWNSINMAWSPWAYEQMDANNFDTLKSGAKYILIGFGILISGVMLFGPEILWIMGGNSYMEAVKVIPPVMAGYAVQAVYSFYVNIETFSKKQKNIALATSIAAVVNVVLNWLCIPIFGYLAAAYTTLVGYIILLCLHYQMVRKLKRHMWYSSRFNFAFVAFFVLYMMLCNLLYIYNIIRYIAIGFIFAVVIVVVIKERQLIHEMAVKKSFKPFWDRIGLAR